MSPQRLRATAPVAIAEQARKSLLAMFLLMGMVSMGWVPRIPEIKDAIGLSNGQFGFILLASTFGSVTGAQLGGRAIHTFGSRKVTRVAITIMPLGLAGMGLANTASILVLSLFVMGFGYSLMDICLNSQGFVVEKIIQKRCMSSLHAMWSVGAFLTTVLGGSIARFVSYEVNLVGIAIFAGIAFVPAAFFLLPGDLDDHDGGAEETNAKIPLFGKSVLPLWGIGIGLLGCLIAEGAAGDWAGILLRDDMGYDKGINASGFACFALAMIVSRFLGDKALDRLGPALTVKLGAYIGGVTLGAAILIAVPLSDSYPLLSLIIINVGFIALGFGIGPMFPAFILAAGATPGVAPAVAIARVGVIGIAGYFFGPTLTGLISEVSSLPIALFFPISMLFLSGYLSRTIHTKKDHN
ncbi:MAG: MFS transporter [Candidatus Planktophila sp.]